MGIRCTIEPQTSVSIFIVTDPDLIKVRALNLSEVSALLSAPSKDQVIDLMSPCMENFKSFSVITPFSQKTPGVSIW